MIHREALAAKRFTQMKGQKQTEPNAFEELLHVVVRVINEIRSKALNTRLFKSLCEGAGADVVSLLMHCEVRWLSRGKALGRVFHLRKEIQAFLKSKSDARANLFSDHSWLVQLAYLADIFQHLNTLNLSLQGDDRDVFHSMDKVNAFKGKIVFWKSDIGKRNFMQFPNLQVAASEAGDNFDISCMTDLLMDHLNVLEENFDHYFHDEEVTKIASWIRNTFDHNSLQVSGGPIS
jgi:hypothetical protein